MRNIDGWIGFEGAPCSGKSTALEAINSCREKYAEIARILLDGGGFGGTSIKQVTEAGQYPFFQKSVVLLNKKNCSMGQDEGSIIDASNVTAQAYVRDLQEPFRSKLTNIIAAEMVNNPPRKVFVFEPLKYQQDGVRHQDEEYQREIHYRILEFCEKACLDYYIVRPGPLELRLKYVKSAMKK